MQTCELGDLRPNEQVAVILDKSNFYAEMGGQIGGNPLCHVSDDDTDID